MADNYNSKLERLASHLEPLNFPSSDNKSNMISKRDIKSLRNYIQTKRHLEKKVFSKIEIEFSYSN